MFSLFGGANCATDHYLVVGKLGDDNADINGALENIRENIKTKAIESLGYGAFKQYKSWFDRVLKIV
jgi:hypothetical protein